MLVGRAALLNGVFLANVADFGTGEAQTVVGAVEGGVHDCEEGFAEALLKVPCNVLFLNSE